MILPNRARQTMLLKNVMIDQTIPHYKILAMLREGDMFSLNKKLQKLILWRGLPI